MEKVQIYFRSIAKLVLAIFVMANVILPTLVFAQDRPRGSAERTVVEEGHGRIKQKLVLKIEHPPIVIEN